jgi:hypothetical protein
MSEPRLLRLGRWVTANRDLLNLLVVGLLVAAITVLAFVAVAALHTASNATARADCNTRLISALTGQADLPAADPACSLTAVRKALEDRALKDAELAQLEADRKARHLPALPTPSLSPVPGGGRVVVVPRQTPSPHAREAPRTGPTTSRRTSAPRASAAARTSARPSPRPSVTRTPRPSPSCVATLPPLVGLPTCVKG